MHLPLTLTKGHPRYGEKALEKMPINQGIFDREAALVGLPSFEPYLGCLSNLDMTQPVKSGELDMI
jgi:hypothetical protein